MALTFYYGSGSPPAWRVWLALEHKALPHELRQLSFQGGDLKTPEFLALNPRGKVPTLVDDGFALWESAAIVEYLDQKYPERRLIPSEPRAAATVRRLIQECDHYLATAVGLLMRQTLFRPQGDGDAKQIEEATATIVRELEYFERALAGEFFVGGAVTAADFAVYTTLALLRRLAERKSPHAVAIPPKLTAWMERIEALPYLAKTIPPHWK